MSHAYARNYLHIVFGTRERRPYINPHLQENLWSYLRGIARPYGIDVRAIGGTADHVHMLALLPPKISVATVVRLLKANSSKWMNESGHVFGWQQGYGAFSVSVSNLNSVAEYIQNQVQHHAHRSFDDEFRTLLKKHGIEPTSDVLG